MRRKEGFIDLDKILLDNGVDTTSIDTMTNSQLVKTLPNSGKCLLLELENELYYYKYNKYISPYNELIANELIANELAHDFEIDAVDYDLAILKNQKGVISKNFRKKDATYITGEKLLSDFGYDPYTINHNLENIWDALEQRYHNKPEIIKKLMNKIVSIFIFDIILCQYDRNAQNWEIEEFKDNIDIVPIYDNERILMENNKDNYLILTVNDISHSLKDNLEIFLNISSKEYKSMIEEKLWIISSENLKSVFKRIENKTGYPMSKEIKEYYLKICNQHRKNIEEVINNNLERDEQNERKNR